MSATQTVVHSNLQQWIAEKLDHQTLKERLLAMGMDEESIHLHLTEWKKLNYAKRQTTGFIYLVIGALLGFISCVMSIINPIPDLYYWFLYGLTSMALSIIFIGLYFVFE